MPFLPPLTFLILLLCNSEIIPSVSSLNDEGLALLTFKRSITQDPSGSLSDWNSFDDTPCFWNGVICRDQRVVSVSIPNKKLSGSLSPSLGSLPEIRHLNLRSNRFYGVLPPELFGAEGLQSLVLSGNYLSGPLPSEVGNLQFVQNLVLSSNFLNGSLPASLIRCTRLRSLDFSRNNFTGSLPADFGGSLVSLETLDLSHNAFSGSIPGDLGLLSDLQGTLDLSHNMFNGSIPSDLGDLPEKVYIDLTYNNLTGPIPQSGALINRGPTAFIGNLALCGPPLKKPCSLTGETSPPPSPTPYFPSNSSSQSGKSSGGRRLSKASIAAILICDLVGICVIGLVLSYCYLRFRPCGGNADSKNELDCKSKSKWEFPCFGKHESETSSEVSEQYGLVALDGRMSFDLDELLKASAFVLGKSGIGILYKVVLEDGQCLAVRRLGDGGSQRFKEFRTEVEAIGKLRHPNIVNLRCYYWSADEKLLIYDLMQNGNLASAIHGKPGSPTFDPLPWSARLKIMKGIARGLVYLHEYSPKKYVHGNLKPTNILLSQDAEPMISDFGLAHLAVIIGASSGGSHSSRAAVFENQISESTPAAALPPSSSFGSAYYQAPESVKAVESVRAVKPSQKWDVYSYGVILLEMITGRPPLVQVGPTLEMELVQWMQVCVEEGRPLSEVVDAHLVREKEREDEEIIEVLKVAMACVDDAPERRPTMKNLLESFERLGMSD